MRRCWDWSGDRWGRAYVSVGVIVLLASGTGFRYLLGLPLYFTACGLALAAVIIAFRSSLREIRVPLLVGSFVALAALSTLWSVTKTVTLLAAIALAVVSLVAIIIAKFTSRLQALAYLYRGLQVSVVGGLLFELYVSIVVRAPLPRHAEDLATVAQTDPDALPMWSDNLLFHGGPIQGFVGNRNPFGSLALLLAIIAVVLLLERRIRRLDGFLTLAAAALVYVLTDSATVAITLTYVTVVAIAALLIRAAPVRYKRPLSFAVLACSAVVAVLTIKYREQIFGFFDRGSDATNRTTIWNAVVDAALQRPEGWGYVGYWPVWHEPYHSIGDRVGMVVPHGHNAYLDAWLQLGLIGLALLVGIVVLTFGSAWRLVERAGRGDTYIPLGWTLLTAAVALEAMSESRMLVEWGWFLLVMLYCSGPQALALTVVDPELVRTATDPAAPVADEDPVLVLARQDTPAARP